MPSGARFGIVPVDLEPRIRLRGLLLQIRRNGRREIVECCPANGHAARISHRKHFEDNHFPDLGVTPELRKVDYRIAGLLDMFSQG